MRIVVVSDWFSEKMGYAENFLPKALAFLGAEVHVVTSNVQPYFDSPFYRETYEPFIGPGIVECGVQELDGYCLHRLPHDSWRGKLRIRGLQRKIWEIRPQIVQAFDTYCPSTYELALTRPFGGYRLFLESHLHASVFPASSQWLGLRWRFNWLLYAATIGRLVSLMSDKCYPISTDAADIIIQFFGYQASKVSICSLGVDTDLFKPASNGSHQEDRQRLRRRLGFAPDDIVCIYTGRMTKDKGPLVLAEAVASLATQGYSFRGLFVGSGQSTDLEAIKALPGCVVNSFVPVRELAQYYRAADIGVWPKQESTSQLDAAACGLPIIVSDEVKVRERVDGNGLLYVEGCASHLSQQMLKLSDPGIRNAMGKLGASKMREQFSWRRIAGERLRDYECALTRKSGA